MAGLNIVSVVAATLILAAVAADGHVLTGTYPIAAAAGATARPPTGTRSRTSATVYACTARDIRFDVCNGLKSILGVTTPQSMLEAVRVSLAKARAAKGKLAEARKSSRAGNPMASILQSCTKNYDDLVCALEEAERSMHKAHDSNYNVVTKMTAASTYACDCENWFEERRL